MIASRFAASTRAVARTARAAAASYTTYSQLPEEHRMIHEMCRKFANEELSPNAGEWDKNHEYPTNAIAQLVSSDVPYPTVPYMY
jgi:butyryl-CoA dehydrogenase